MSQLARGYVIKVVVHDAGVPWTSIVLGAQFDMPADATLQRAQLHSIFATYSNLSFTLLPHPYDSNCRDYRLDGLSGRRECHYRCLERLAVARFNKSHYSNLIYEPRKHKHLSVYDLMNETINEQLKGMESRCARLCAQPPCAYHYSITSISVAANPHVQDLHVQIPYQPFMHILHLPAMQLVEFLVYVLSCLGVWFGVSVLSLNPVALLSKWQSRSSSSRVGPMSNRFATINLMARRCNNELHKVQRKLQDYVTRDAMADTIRVVMTQARKFADLEEPQFESSSHCESD